MLNYESLYLNLPAEHQIWFGKQPPFYMHSVYIEHSSGFRLHSSLHTKFKQVWIYEKSLATYESWEAILDEAIRCLEESGNIIIRFNQTDECNVIKIKRYLYRHKFLTAEVSEECFDGSYFEINFTIHRKAPHIYKDRSWTMALLTTGNKVDNVVSFCKSIRQFGGQDIQILICGPKNIAYSEFNVEYVDVDTREGLAEISKKKNVIAQHAIHNNLLIAHDRYILNPDFINGFEAFGYDFDFVTINQNYECGSSFPCIAKLRTALAWCRPIIVEKPEDIDNRCYANGGLLIFKKSSLESIKMNDLLFWNQAEDVEISRAFYDCSIPLRWNVLSSATTIGITPDYTSTFIVESKKQDDKFQSESALNNYILKHYLYFLNREPDSSGYEHYSSFSKTFFGKLKFIVSIAFSPESLELNGVIGAIKKIIKCKARK
ncbi:hypothetical protein HR060_08585 [Catenovulum sp. SM1970]|uniref:hypothetical protein n=1 Tax=Marinifaba aquimaris TaxID=2741323 RepID=UPI001572C708|nr:hypothetical protein [Marinifaba aquimaris]NTS76926.1 hypothetical protein [Marinifaba aquimaris]